MFVRRDATILHADLDAFFAAVEQRDHPELRGRPVLVGAGVVLCPSYEAKARGVQSAMGVRRALRLCPDAIVVRPRMSAYSEASKDVYRVFDDTTPLVEGLSIDEAFLDVAGMERSVGKPRGDRPQPQERGPQPRRPSDHGRDRPDEVPGQGRERRRQARRAAGRAARPRARVPPPAPGRETVGRGQRHGAQAPRRGAADGRPGRTRPGDGARDDARARRRPQAPRARAQPRPAPRADRPAPPLDRRPARARLERDSSPRSTSLSSPSSSE